MRALVAALALPVILLLAAPAVASETNPTLSELSGEIMCPVCAGETIDQSQSAIAQRMKQFIAARIAAGDTKSEIKEQLVAQFGEQVLAAPPKKGFNLLAWLLPPVGVVAAGGVLGVLAWRWAKRRQPRAAEADGALDPELERRVDDELARFDY